MLLKGMQRALERLLLMRARARWRMSLEVQVRVQANGIGVGLEVLLCKISARHLACLLLIGRIGRPGRVRFALGPCFSVLGFQLVFDARVNHGFFGSGIGSWDEHQVKHEQYQSV